MQLITYGTQDLTLTGNPQITFFYIVYRRYTNFGKKIIELAFDNTPLFNSTSYINIPKNNGDLLSKSILKIVLPKINFTLINSTLNKFANNQNEYISTSALTYYDYYIKFYNKLKNIINSFFIKYDINFTSLTYIIDLKNNILNYLNTDQFSQFFLSIDFFFNNSLNVNNVVNYNIDLYTNASLFKIINNNLTYIYELFSYSNLSYEGFKFAVQKNLEILAELNIVIFDKLNNILYKNDIIKVAWVNKIAIYLFNSIEFYVGSNKIYSLSDSYINNHSELYFKNKNLYSKLIGSNTEINIFSNLIEERTLYLPIPFWEFSNFGLSFPLIALQYNSLQIRISTKKLIECIKISYDKQLYSDEINNEIINLLVNNLNEILSNKLEITLLLEYIYLDSIERKKFALSAHEYLIEQVQEIEFDKISTINNTIQLDVFHCCKDMYWFAQKNTSQNDIFNMNLDVFDYTYKRNNIILQNSLQYFVNYSYMFYNPIVLFNPFIFNQGIYIVNNNLKYISNYSFLINSFSNRFVFGTLNSKLNIIIQESYFNLNGVQLIGENYYFFNFLQPYNYYNSTPQLGLNVYSFSLRPTEFQPAGSCNMSRISSIGLKLKINDIGKDELENLSLDNTNRTSIFNEYKLIYQIRNYNVLRLIGGIGATAYTY